MNEKEKYPPIRLKSEIHCLLKVESKRSGRPMGEIVEVTMRGCMANPDLWSHITGGAFGTQPPWAVDEEQAKREVRDRSQLEEK